MEDQTYLPNNMSPYKGNFFKTPFHSKFYIGYEFLLPFATRNKNVTDDKNVIIEGRNIHVFINLFHYMPLINGSPR